MAGCLILNIDCLQMAVALELLVFSPLSVVAECCCLVLCFQSWRLDQEVSKSYTDILASYIAS